jgi:tetraacyldisaccharide 4'-kinase
VQAAWRSRGALAIGLLPLSWLFGALVALRHQLYRHGLKPTHGLPVPVVVVGNLIVGGAGKTPTVLAVVALLKAHGFRPGIVSRGYGRTGDDVVEVRPDSLAREVGDEPLLLRWRSDAPVVVGRDRVEAGRALLRLHPGVNVIVSDDGLQHRRLRRDLQILVFDERGAGNGWLLPAGPLREPMPQALPPHSVVLYNASEPSTPLPGTVARRALSGVVELASWRQGQAPSPGALDMLGGRPLTAVAGIARPQRFFDMLAAAGLTFTPLPLPDHWNFDTLPWPDSTADVIVTEKDAVKLEPARLGATRVWVAPLDFRTDAIFEAAVLAALLQSTLPRTDHGHPIA